MPLQIKDTGEVPSERWHFPVTQTGFDVIAPNWFALYPLIQKHCEANNIQPPSMQEVVDWCCSNLSISCFDGASHEPLINRWAQGFPSLAPQKCCGK